MKETVDGASCSLRGKGAGGMMLFTLAERTRGFGKPGSCLGSETRVFGPWSAGLTVSDELRALCPGNSWWVLNTCRT